VVETASGIRRCGNDGTATRKDPVVTTCRKTTGRRAARTPVTSQDTSSCSVALCQVGESTNVTSPDARTVDVSVWLGLAVASGCVTDRAEADAGYRCMTAILARGMDTVARIIAEIVFAFAGDGTATFGAVVYERRQAETILTGRRTANGIGGRV